MNKWATPKNENVPVLKRKQIRVGFHCRQKPTFVSKVRTDPFTFGTLTPPCTAMLYSGERFDSDLQQYYLRARYYNPTVGRFGVQDQVDGTPNDPLSLHKYAYTRNDPINGRDPSGNEDLISLSFTMSVGIGLDAVYNGAVLYAGYRAGSKATELGQSRESILDAASRDASPGVDAATIIVHGVSGHPNGWSQSDETPFQQDLTYAEGRTPVPNVRGMPLNHDFYEFDWGGFSVDDVPLTLIPIKSVHEMALVHLQMAEFLVWMNGYANINIISHSWGTTLTYDLQNTGEIEIHNWVTMGSPLKPTTDKPVANAGNWINYYSWWDPVVHLEMYPPFPYTYGMPLPSWSWFNPGLTHDQNVDIQHSHYMGSFLLGEHGAYWNDPNVLTHLRSDLQ